MRQNEEAGIRLSGASRREFLIRTAGVAGAAAVFAAAGGAERLSAASGKPVRAKARTPVGDGETIRMAVIGTGGMGTGHCDSIINLIKDGRENAQIVALCDVCDPRLQHAKQLCEEKQGISVDTYREHEKLLEREDIHGVLIAVPEHQHQPVAEDAILAGKDVYLEKPMTLTLEQAMRLYELQKANPDIRVQIGTQMMQLPKYKAAQKLIAEDAIGKPTFSQTSYCRNSKDGEWLYYGIDPKWEPGVNLDWKRWCGHLYANDPWDPEVYARWRRYKKWSTGIIGDLLVHEMTPMLMAINQGWPTRVVACGGHYIDKKMENHDQVNLTVEFEKGHTMIVAGSTCNEVGLERIIRGHKGNIYLGGANCELRPERLFADDIDKQEIPSEDIGNDQDAHRVFWLNCIRTRGPVASSVELGTQIMVIVHLATRSMWEGKAFTFDPKTMTAKAV